MTPDEEKALEERVTRNLEKTMQNAELAIDSASIVFGLSILEAVAMHCLQFTKEADPKYWRNLFAKRELSDIKLQDLKTMTYERVVFKNLSIKGFNTMREKGRS